MMNLVWMNNINIVTLLLYRIIGDKSKLEGTDGNFFIYKILMFNMSITV